MSSRSLENDLLDIPLVVRMQDVQSSTERVSDTPLSPSKHDTVVYAAYLINDIEYENQYVVNNNDDSNIGSVMSLQTGDVIANKTMNKELIIPESLPEMEPETGPKEFQIFINSNGEVNVTERYLDNPIETVGTSGGKCDNKIIRAKKKCTHRKCRTNLRHIRLSKNKRKESAIKASTLSNARANEMLTMSNSKILKQGGPAVSLPSKDWPTLEILPGGVINNTDCYDSDDMLQSEEVPKTTKLSEMYACAKCSQTFKYLFGLVRHVKLHDGPLRRNKPKTDTKCNV